MSMLKVVAAAFLGFFLSLSLLIFGLAFTVNMTALNADFVTSSLEELDISTLAEEIISEQITEEELPEEFTEELRVALVDTIDRLEPVVKERANDAIYDIYDYLLGKSQSPDLALTLRNTLLNSEFVTSFLEELDISSLAEAYLSSEVLQEEFPEEFTEELRVALVDTIDRLEPIIKEEVSIAAEPVFDYLLGESQSLDLALTLRNTLLNSDFINSLLDELDMPSLLNDVDISSLAWEFLSQQSTEEIDEEIEYLVDYIDVVIIELEPWIREQVSTAADPVFDYLLGESQGLNVVISLESVRETLGNTLREAFLESPPVDLAGLSQTELEQYFDTLFEEFFDDFPSTFELDESVLGTDVLAEIADMLAEAEMGLEQGRQDIAEAIGEAEEVLGEARRYIGYYQTGFGFLIGFMLLAILGIILINRQVKRTSRTLGGIFLTYGAVNLIAVFIARALAKPPIAQLDIPLSIQEWLVQLINSSLTPLLILAIVLIIAGVALLVVSFIYHRRQTPMATEMPL